MAEHGERNTAEEWTVVRRPGVMRLADSVVQAHSASTLTRRRGDTMIALAETLAPWRIGAEVEHAEPDGSKWSLKITVEDTDR